MTPPSNEPQVSLTSYFAGNRLYGDDFTREQIAAWYEEEREGYADLVARESASYEYVYHALNTCHGFRHLPDRRFPHVLGFGSANGDEFKPLVPRIDRLTIVEPSEAFVRTDVHGIPARYVKPAIDGTLPFDEDTFDLVTCLGVLHHIPNVSHVLGELYRCLRPGGYALLSNLFAWNVRYHAANAFQKLRPTNVFFVLGKPKSPER